MIPLDIFGGAVALIREGIAKIWPDPAQQAEAQRKLLELEQAGAFKAVDERMAALSLQVQVILAEANGQSWLQRNWRPVLMLTIVCIIANNYLIAPYLRALFGAANIPLLDLPERLWDLMNLGLGGYVVGRSAEKCITTWKAK